MHFSSNLKIYRVGIEGSYCIGVLNFFTSKTAFIKSRLISLVEQSGELLLTQAAVHLVESQALNKVAAISSNDRIVAEMKCSHCW